MKKIKLKIHTSGPAIDYEKALNPEQCAVVMHPGGSMLVLAGAGSGKTRTVTYRVARLLEKGVPSSAILLLTFTNRAAREMMQRVEELTGGSTKGLWGGTFHHIGNIILRRHAGVLGYRDGFSIIDREDQKELLESSMAETKLQESLTPKGAVLAELYSFHRNTLIPLEDLFYGRYYHLLEIAEEVQQALMIYEEKKRRLNLMDFDDLLLNTLRLLKEHQELREFYASRFLHILVDEYQDTNLLQAEMVDLLAGVHRNVMVVGDDAQSIYSFRGARIENILRFADRYPDATVFKLTTNYRSTPEILNLANRSIEHNVDQFKKELKAVLPSGPKPVVIALGDLYEQARFVAAMVRQLLDGGIPAEEIAVLYRSHYQSMEIQMELQKQGLNFEVRSGLRFFEQAHIKDILSYLRILYNPFDELSWKRVLKMIPKIGNVTAHRIWSFISNSDNPFSVLPEAATAVQRNAIEGFNIFVSNLRGLLELDYRQSPDLAISYVLEHGYEDYLYNTYPNAESRYEDIVQLIRYAERYRGGAPLTGIDAEISMPYSGLEMLLSDLSLERMEESSEEGSEGVILSTIHQAKGLEWQIVFIIGLNEGRFPSRKALVHEGIEEERRLFYVGCTRAKNQLYLCYTLSDNGYTAQEPSRFLTELPDDVYEEVEIEYEFR